MLKGNHLIGSNPTSTPGPVKSILVKVFFTNQDLCFSVPQGSVCGPVSYNAYASTMNTVVPPTIAIHAYADDHALKKEFISSIPQEEAETARSLSKCLDNVKDWMNSCCLKMNSDKTEVFLKIIIELFFRMIYL